MQGRTLPVSIFVPAAEAKIGTWCQGVAWSKDSKTVLAQCMADREILAFRFDGKDLEKTAFFAVKGEPSGVRTAKP